MHAKTKRNFEIFSAEDFIAAITQHIPEKGFQTCPAVAMGRQGRRRMVRYYGWYSNRARGARAKKRAEGVDLENPAGLEVIDIAEYQPPRIPSKKWRELIKKVWEVDPFACPRCGSEMRMVALIDDHEVIEKILRHLGLWPENSLPSRHHFFARFRCVTPPKAGPTIDFKPSRWQAPFMISGKLGIVGRTRL